MVCLLFSRWQVNGLHSIFPGISAMEELQGREDFNNLDNSFADYSVVKIPQPKEGCNDADPMWIGDKIYFLSDRNGEFNLFSYGTATKEVKQLTPFKDFPILKASAGNGKIIFEQEGYLHMYDIKFKF